MSEAEQKAAHLLNEIADMAWSDAVNLVAAALREAWQTGHDSADGEPYTDREKLIAERDAAFVRGLERAREIAYTLWQERDYFDDLIQAEIEKAKAGK